MYHVLHKAAHSLPGDMTLMQTKQKQVENKKYKSDTIGNLIILADYATA